MAFSRSALALLAAAAVVGMAAAGCNMCSGHGDCGANDLCTCWDNYMGADCSLRVCPYDHAFTDVPSDINTAHNYAECSNAGVCDRETGECQCREGYTGRACERTTCMNDCSGHGVCRTLSELAQNGLPQVGGNETRYYQQWDGAKVQGCVCDAGYEGVDCSLRSCPRGDDPLTTGQAAWVNTVALRGRFYGDFSLVVIDSYGTEWSTRPIKAQRDTTSEAIGGNAALAGGALTFVDNGILGTTAPARTLRPGDSVTVGGGASLYVTAIDYVTDPPVATVTDTTSTILAAAVVREASTDPSAEIKAALEALPNRVIEDVTVAIDSASTPSNANLANFGAHLGLQFQVTFNSPAKLAHPLQVDACPCTTVGCSPFKLGVSFDNGANADGVYVVEQSTNDAGSSLTVAGTNTAAEWATAYGSKCDTTRHIVPKGLYYVEHPTTAVARVREGMSGDWKYVDFADTDTITLFDGITITAASPVADDTFLVVAPFGIESWWSAGAKEDAVCSNRGLCDYETGICQCFSCATGLACETQTTLT